MKEGLLRGFEVGYGTAEARPGDALAQRIETGPEKPEPRVEYGPDDSNITFIWDGKQYSVSMRAAVVGSIIYVDHSSKGDPSEWFGLKVTGISNSQPPAIETLSIFTVNLKPRAVQQFIAEGIVFQAFLKE